MRLQRLNLDASWHFTFGDLKFVIDPWLIGSEIDGFKWLNEAWHIKEPVKLEEIPAFDFIVITQSYEDHCHLNTLDLMDGQIPILATGKAYHRLLKKYPKREILLIPNLGETLDYKGYSFSSIKPNRRLDPIYYALVIADKNKEALFYAPHGFALTKEELTQINSLKFKLLATTFTKFQLPSIMGGLVNPGMENVRTLYKQLSPKHLVNTHDEQKKMSGIVSKLGKVKYADYEQIKSTGEFNFLEISDYSPIILD